MILLNICALYLPIVVFGLLGCDKRSDYFDIDELTMAYITKYKDKNSEELPENLDAYKDKLYGNTMDKTYKDNIINDEVDMHLVDRKG